MGFGQTTKDSTKDTTYTPNPAVSGAATSNLNYASNVQNTPFTPYSGNQVAQFGGLQQQSLDAAGNPTVANMIGAYSGAPAGSVSPGTIAGSMNPYMNQYVNLALAPQIQAQQQQFDAQNRNQNASATSSGAFGDARAGIEASNLTNQQNIARQGLIGGAYNAAFNTAIGAGAQDVSNNLQGQEFNVNNQNTALNRQLTGAEALQGNIGFQNTLGQQQTAQSQAGLNANYNQWLMGQQRPYQNIQAMNSAIDAGARGMPANSSTTTSSPDNSGWGMLGSIGGTVLGGVLGGPVGASIGGSLGSGVGNWFGGGNTGGTNTPDGGAGFGANGQQLPGNFSSASPSGYADGGEPPVGKPAIVGERGPELFIPHSSSQATAPEQPKAPAPRPFGWPPHIPGFADGGQPPVGRPSMVGERGPELFVPHEPGTIVPHEALTGGATSGFSHAFTGKPNVSRPRAMKNKAPRMMPPPAANNNANLFGAAA